MDFLCAFSSMKTNRSQKDPFLSQSNLNPNLVVALQNQTRRVIISIWFSEKLFQWRHQGGGRDKKCSNHEILPAEHNLKSHSSDPTCPVETVTPKTVGINTIGQPVRLCLSSLSRIRVLSGKFVGVVAPSRYSSVSDI